MYVYILRSGNNVCVAVYQHTHIQITNSVLLRLCPQHPHTTPYTHYGWTITDDRTVAPLYNEVIMSPGLI